MAVNPNYLYVILDSFHGVSNVPYKAMLVNPNYQPNPLNEAGVSEAAAYEIPGVARIELTGLSLIAEPDGTRIRCDDLVFEGLDGATDVGGVVIYLETDASIPANDAGNLMVSWDLDDGPFTPPAGQLTYLVDDNDGFALFTV